MGRQAVGRVRKIVFEEGPEALVLGKRIAERPCQDIKARGLAISAVIGACVFLKIMRDAGQNPAFDVARGFDFADGLFVSG